MKKYAIGIFNAFTGYNKVAVVDAKNEVDAIVKAYIETDSPEDTKEIGEWLKEIGEMDLADAIAAFSDCDIVVSMPVEIPRDNK